MYIKGKERQRKAPKGKKMKVVKYYWLNWDSARPVIEGIEMRYPCFVSVCRALGYVRIECRVEDAEAILNRLKGC